MPETNAPFVSIIRFFGFVVIGHRRAAVVGLSLSAHFGSAIFHSVFSLRK